MKRKNISTDNNNLEQSKVKQTPNRLSVSQLNTFETWYAEHRTSGIGPYPTNDDKENLHQVTNVSIEYMERWFELKRMAEDSELKISWDPNRSTRTNNLNINRSSDVLIELDRKLIEQPKCPICKEIFNTQQENN